MVDPDRGFKRTVGDLKAMMSNLSDSFWDRMEQIDDYNSVKEIVLSPEIEQVIREVGFQNVDVFAERVNDYVRSNRAGCPCSIFSIPPV